MNEFTEVTAENLRFIRGLKDMNQDEIAGILGIPRNAISKIESGTRSLASAEKALLDLYFFGTIPFEIVNEKLLEGVLDFTTDQWRVICILANRNSLLPGQWIADKIRSYLAFNEQAKSVQAEIVRERFQSMPPKEENWDSIVADEPK